MLSGGRGLCNLCKMLREKIAVGEEKSVIPDMYPSNIKRLKNCDVRKRGGVTIGRGSKGERGGKKKSEKKKKRGVDMKEKGELLRGNKGDSHLELM